MQLDYEINPTEHDDHLVTLTCHKYTQRATSPPFPRTVIATTLADALDQRSAHSRAHGQYDVRFTNTNVQITLSSQVIAEFPIIFAPNLIAQARSTEGDLFAS